MQSATKEDIALLKESGVFDADWYRSAYSDVRSLQMDPAEHYLRYGQSMGRMSADGEKIDISILKTLQGLPAPKKGHTLMEANEICLSGNDALGFVYARKHLPAEFAYTIESLRANKALRHGDEAGWLEHLSRYLSHFGPLALRLEGEGSVFERLATKPVQPITDGPLISVMMPAWNAEATLRKAAESILDQSWRQLELLIVDDASQDGTWGVMLELAARDPRVRIFRNRINVGPYVSKNIALTQAKGDWITGHDADDWAVPRRLERHMAAVIMGNGVKASLTYMIRTQPEGMIDSIGRITDFTPDGVARISSISALFERAFMREHLGHWDSVRFAADSEMISRARTILGTDFKQFRQIGMICLSLPSGLTNHPEMGVTAGATGGLSPARQAFKSAWTNWHKSLAGQSTGMMLFPISDERPYPAPEEMVVPVRDIERNLRNDW